MNDVRFITTRTSCLVELHFSSVCFNLLTSQLQQQSSGLRHTWDSQVKLEMTIIDISLPFFSRPSSVQQVYSILHHSWMSKENFSPPNEMDKDQSTSFLAYIVAGEQPSSAMPHMPFSQEQHLHPYQTSTEK